MSYHAALSHALVMDAVITSPQFDKADLSNPTHTGAVYDGTGTLVLDSLRTKDYLWSAADPCRIPSPIATTQEIPAGIYLGHFFPHFGHFLLETLTALFYSNGSDLPLIFHAWDSPNPDLPRFLNRPYVKLSLEALGILPSRIIFVTDPVQVRALYVPPRGAMMRGDPIPETLSVYRRVAEAAENSWPDTGSRRLYLSRRLWQLRKRAANEDQIEEAFCSRGFRVIYPEQMNFFEQTAIVSRAKVVAGIRGSNLHLTSFMRPGSKAIQITHRPMGQVKAINDILGIATETYFKGEISKEEQAPEPVIKVDIPALNEFLDASGLK